MSASASGGFASAIVSRLPFLNRKKGGSHMRAHQRIPCCIMAELLIVDRSFKLEGLVIEVSRGGMRFREASAYILNRNGIKATVLAAGGEYAGVIVNTGQNGYGLKLDTLISEEEMERIVATGAPQGLNAA